MNSKAFLYLKLEDTKKTSFHQDGQVFQVASAPAATFDAFVSELIEEITDLDRAEWEIFDRWDVLNELLKEGVLTMVEVPDGFLVELPPEEETAEVEETASSVAQQGGAA